MKETIFDTYLEDYLMDRMFETAFDDEEACNHAGTLYYNPAPQESADDFGYEPPIDPDDTKPSQLPRSFR